MHIKKWSLAALLCLIGASSLAKDDYVIIGGGPVPDAAQVSIEQNVLWIDSVLQQFEFEDRRVLFGAGKEGVLDVVLHAPDDTSIRHWLPLARLYGKQQKARTQYRPNAVYQSEGGFSKENVQALLHDEIQQMQGGDNLLLVYSGHGSLDSRDVSKNALRLWGEAALDTNEFAALLENTPSGATVRYVLPQCFSGAFARSNWRNPAKPAVAGVATNRCGFFAVDERTEAEGCTPGIDAGDYRDYATYFIAALAGKSRVDEPLTTQPDRNGDGKISLNEAHAYAYTEGFSTDIPRSTSDYFLELWEPWYARWHSFVPLSNGNPYWLNAKRLAQRLALAGNTPTEMARQAQEQRQRLFQALEAEQQAHDADHVSAEHIRKELLRRFLREWPHAMYPQSAGYVAFLQNEADDALQWVRSQPEFPKLESMQDDVSASALRSLELQRQDAQYSRLLRALRFAAIKENFERLASGTEREQYAALTRCEAWAPPRRSATESIERP